MFIELIRKSGIKITVNSDQIGYVVPGDDSGSIVFLDGTYISVTEPFDVVVARLNETFAPVDKRLDPNR